MFPSYSIQSADNSRIPVSAAPALLNHLCPNKLLCMPVCLLALRASCRSGDYIPIIPALLRRLRTKNRSLTPSKLPHFCPGFLALRASCRSGDYMPIIPALPRRLRSKNHLPLLQRRMRPYTTKAERANSFCFGVGKVFSLMRGRGIRRLRGYRSSACRRC